MKPLLTIILLLSTIFKTQGQSAMLNKADSLYVNGNYSKAIETYKKHSDSAVVLDRIAKAYIALGNYDAALINYDKSIIANPEDALVKYEYAKLLAKTKKYQDASDMFYKLIDIDYKNPNYHYELGLVLEHLKDSTAQNRFYSAFQLDKTHQKAIYRLAKFHLKKGHNKRVDYYTDIGLKSYEDNRELISLKAQNYYVKKDYNNAAVWFEKLIALNESSQFIHEKLRNCYAQQYEFEKAIEQGEFALQFDEKNTNNLFVQGELYERIEDFKKAEEYMLQSLLIQDQPMDEEYVKLGFVYSKQKKYKETIEVYKKAIKENPANDRAHFLLVYVKDHYYKDIDTKIKLYETFKTKFPESKYTAIVNQRISELKQEKFLKTD